MYKLYSMQRSGNSYKVRLALALLKAPYCAIEIDILRGESRTPEFLAKNPSGQVPLLEAAEGRYLAESNAILVYVAGGTPPPPQSHTARPTPPSHMSLLHRATQHMIWAASPPGLHQRNRGYTYSRWVRSQTSRENKNRAGGAQCKTQCVIPPQWLLQIQNRESGEHDKRDPLPQGLQLRCRIH